MLPNLADRTGKARSHRPILEHGSECTNIFHPADDGSSELAICHICKHVITDVTGMWQHIVDLYSTTYDQSR